MKQRDNLDDIIAGYVCDSLIILVIVQQIVLPDDCSLQLEVARVSGETGDRRGKIVLRAPGTRRLDDFHGSWFQARWPLRRPSPPRPRGDLVSHL